MVLGFWIVFDKIFGDRIIGAILTAAISTSLLSFCYIGFVVVKSPVFRAVLLDPTSRKKLAKEFVGLHMGNFVFMTVLGVLICYYTLFPALSGDFYGDATRPLVWFCIITFPGTIGMTWMSIWGDIIPVPVAKRSVDLIERYAASPSTFYRTLFQIEYAACSAQLRPGSSFPLSALRFLDRFEDDFAGETDAGRTPLANHGGAEKG